jgi:hypothetical protein
VQVVTKKESGMRCTGEARGTPGEVWESGLEVCGRVQGSTAECEGAWQSTRERKGVWQSVRVRGRAWQSTGAQERTRKCKSVKGTWKPQNAQFQGLARHWLCHLLPTKIITVPS